MFFFRGLSGSLISRGLSFILGVDRYVFFRADTDTDYYRSSRPITDILNRYMSGVKMKMNAKINNNKSSDKKKNIL